MKTPIYVLICRSIARKVEKDSPSGTMISRIRSTVPTRWEIDINAWLPQRLKSTTNCWVSSFQVTIGARRSAIEAANTQPPPRDSAVRATSRSKPYAASQKTR